MRPMPGNSMIGLTRPVYDHNRQRQTTQMKFLQVKRLAVLP